jgi:hypothetical protein
MHPCGVGQRSWAGVPTALPTALCSILVLLGVQQWLRGGVTSGRWGRVTGCFLPVSCWQGGKCCNPIHHALDVAWAAHGERCPPGLPGTGPTHPHAQVPRQHCTCGRPVPPPRGAAISTTLLTVLRVPCTRAPVMPLSRPLSRRCCASPAGATVNVGLDPSKVVITKLKIDKDRKALLERKKGAKAAKGKYTEEEVAMQDID